MLSPVSLTKPPRPLRSDLRQQNNTEEINTSWVPESPLSISLFSSSESGEEFSFVDTPTSPTEEIEESKRKKRRTRALEEIIHTEESYVRDLRIIINVRLFIFNCQRDKTPVGFCQTIEGSEDYT